MAVETEFAIDDSFKAILLKMVKANIVDGINGETIVRPISKGKVYFAMNEVVNVEEEIAKIEKELKNLEAEINRSNGILSNENFIKKAPLSKVEREKEKLAKYQTSYDTLLAKLKELK